MFKLHSKVIVLELIEVFPVHYNIVQQRFIVWKSSHQVEFGTAIFEGVADVCYNMLDHWEQYKHYLNLMKLIHVPVHLKASASALVIPPAADPLGSQSTTANQGKDFFQIFCLMVFFTFW